MKYKYYDYENSTIYYNSLCYQYIDYFSYLPVNTSGILKG